jgi:hypothetical protein
MFQLRAFSQMRGMERHNAEPINTQLNTHKTHENRHTRILIRPYFRPSTG